MADCPLPPHLDPTNPMATMKALQREIWSRLPAADTELLANHLKKHPTSFATACSGTDSISHWITEGCSFMGLDSSVWSHAFSCEIDSAKVSYIQDQFPNLRKCFSDICSLSAHAAINVLDSHLKPEKVDDVGSIVTGLSCKDLSSLNPFMQFSLGGTAGPKSGKSGYTYSGLKAFLRNHGCDEGIMENVTNLHATPDEDMRSFLDVIMHDLAQLGFSSVAIKLSPHQFGIPHHRFRFYVQFSRKVPLVMLQDAIKLVQGCCSDTMLPIECFMVAEDSAYVKDQLCQRQEGCANNHDHTVIRTAGKKKWKRRKQSCTEASPYLDPIASSKLPWVDCLLDRELQVILETPQAAGRFADASQNSERAGFTDPTPGLVQCIAPGALLWDRLLHRELLGLERLALQGVFPRPETLAKYKNSELNDLAGNGFPAMLVWLIAVATMIMKARVYVKDDEADAIINGSVSSQPQVQTSQDDGQLPRFDEDGRVNSDDECDDDGEQ